MEIERRGGKEEGRGARESRGGEGEGERGGD